MRPHGRNVELLTNLYEALGEIKLCDIAAGIAPERVAATAPGDRHSAVQKLPPKLFPAIFLIGCHPAQLELARTGDIRVASLVERPDRHESVAVKNAEVIGRGVVIAGQHAIIERSASSKDPMPKGIRGGC